MVIFFSDNGGLCTRPASSKKNGKGAAGPGCNLPLRAGKGWLYEGGIREAAIVRAPGKAQGIVCNTPMVSTDFYPTILELAGLPLQPELHVDGRSLVPFWTQNPKSRLSVNFTGTIHIIMDLAGPQEEQYARAIGS